MYSYSDIDDHIHEYIDRRNYKTGDKYHINLAFIRVVIEIDNNCLIARDVIAAMLVVKNNSLSLRWELNFIFIQILRNKIVLFWPPAWPPCHVSEIKEYIYIYRKSVYRCFRKTVLNAWKQSAIYVEKQKKTTLSSRQACFVITHSSRD